MATRRWTGGRGLKPLRFSTLAPAKLNLVLAVGSVDAAGYHAVATILQTLDLFDKLSFAASTHAGLGADVVRIDVSGMEAADTLVTEAINRLLALARERSAGPYRRDAHVEIVGHIDKRIPVSAGLGGGSSDAAMALVSVNDALRLRFNLDQLIEIGAAVGSDVPALLVASEGAAAMARGRGENVRPLPELPSTKWALCWPGSGCPTAAVYERFDDRRGAGPAGNPGMELPSDKYLLRAVSAGRLSNDLARAACEVNDSLAQMLAKLEETGLPTIVCGSGATVAVRLDSDPEQRPRDALDTVRSITAADARWSLVASRIINSL